MEFCNKGMVRADPLPPSYGQRLYFDHFIFWDPSLSWFLDFYFIFLNIFGWFLFSLFLDLFLF